MGGLPLTGILGAGLTVGAAVTLTLLARRRRGADRRARWLLAAGLGPVALMPLLTPAVQMAVSRGWLAHSPPGTWLATVAAATCAGATLVLLAGLIGLGAVDSYAGALLRHGLDAAVIVGSLCFIAWAVAAQVHPESAGAPHTVLLACPPAVGSVAVFAAAFGVTASAVRRSRPPRIGMLVGGSGVLLITAGGAATALELCSGLPGLRTTGEVAVAAGALAVTVAAIVPGPTAPDPEAELRSGTAVVLPPVVAVVVTAIYHGLTVGWIDSFGGTAAAVVAVGLVVRHHLTVVDARRYAERLSQREAHFRQLAHTDPLTGLANRRGLLAVLPPRLAGGPACALLALDLDGFKGINDMRGHDAGDAVLVEVGRRIAAHVGPDDVAARLGGDEFAVFLPTTPAHALPVAERLLIALSQPYQVPGATVFLSASIGLAGGATAADVPTLLRNADLALRYAKQQGKARVEEYDAAYDAVQRRRTTLELALREAIGRGELHVVFQPVVALPAIRPAGAEALLRWHHPELGLVPPEEFIPVAEESGQMSAIGAWVLHQACHQLSRLLAEGHDVWVSVNVSPRELRGGGYLSRLSEALATYQVPPQRLVLEITEHAVATDVEELAGQLARLRTVGVRVALDDFGAGYSSLGQLRDLPVDLIKIDHRLVDAGAAAGARAPLVDVVVRLGQRLGLEVIAEGVSDPERLRAVIDAGCRLGQGRFLGRAVPAEHLEAQLGGVEADCHHEPGYPSGRYAGGVPEPTVSDPTAYRRVGKLDAGAQMRQG